jgi:manganese/zinc/iron transport system substrate-binding protein
MKLQKIYTLNMLKMYRIPLVLSLILLFACGEKIDKDSENKPFKIVCTTGMLGDAVQHLAGEQAEVQSLMGPGVDPHLYKATQGDLKALTSADVIVYNGLHLEGKMGEVFEKLQNRKTILVAANAIDRSRLINTTAFQGAYDPHLWFDVALWAEVVDYLGNELAAIESLDAAKIDSARKEYKDQLMKLDKWVAEQLDRVDSSGRVLITAHDAFGYFGRAYDIQVKGLQGISTLSEYGLKDVSELVNFIVERNIQAVFVESSVSDRSLKAVVEGCREKGHEVRIGGTLYSDAMGEAGTEEGTYIGMVKYNVRTIVEGLRGKFEK